MMRCSSVLVGIFLGLAACGRGEWDPPGMPDMSAVSGTTEEFALADGSTLSVLLVTTDDQRETQLRALGEWMSRNGALSELTRADWDGDGILDALVYCAAERRVLAFPASALPPGYGTKRWWSDSDEDGDGCPDLTIEGRGHWFLVVDSDEGALHLMDW